MKSQQRGNAGFTAEPLRRSGVNLDYTLPFRLSGLLERTFKSGTTPPEKPLRADAECEHSKIHQKCNDEENGWNAVVIFVRYCIRPCNLQVFRLIIRYTLAPSRLYSSGVVRGTKGGNAQTEQTHGESRSSMRQKSGSEKKKTGGNPLRWIVWVGIGLLALPLSAIMVVHIPWVQKKIIKGAVQLAEKKSDLRIQLEGYRWHPLTGIRLVDLRVDSMGKDILRCEQARLSYGFSLKRPYILPKELLLVRPVIHLEKDSQGHWQFPGGKASESKTGSGDSSRWLRLPWPDLRIVSGQIDAYQNGEQILLLRDITGKLTLEFVSTPQGPAIRVDLGGWQGKVENPDLGTLRVEARGTFRDGVVSLDHLVADAAGTGRLLCLGAWSFDSMHETELAVLLDSVALGAFPEIERRCPQLKKISGYVRLQVLHDSWLLAHALTSNLGALSGAAEIFWGSGGIRAVRWFTRFSELKVPGLFQAADPNLRGSLGLFIDGGALDRARGWLCGRLETSEREKEAVYSGEISGSLYRGFLEFKADVPEILSAKLLGNFDNGLLDMDYELSLQDLENFSGVLGFGKAGGRAASRGTFEGKWPDLAWSGTIDGAGLRYDAIYSEKASIKGKIGISGASGDRELTARVQGLALGEKKIGALNVVLERGEDALKFRLDGTRVMGLASAKLYGRLENIRSLPHMVIIEGGELNWNQKSASVQAETNLEKHLLMIEGVSDGDLMGIQGDEKGQGSYYNSLQTGISFELPSLGAHVFGNTLSGNPQSIGVHFHENAGNSHHGQGVGDRFFWKDESELDSRDSKEAGEL